MDIAIEIITTITVVAMGIIMAAYLFILKRNGWIGKSTNFRCPNSTCKKIFQKPLEITDLADTKGTHFACPECGQDLDTRIFAKGYTLKKEPSLKNGQILTPSNHREINKTGNLKSNPKTKDPVVNNRKKSSKINPKVFSRMQKTIKTKPFMVKHTKNIVNSTKSVLKTKPKVVRSKEIKKHAKITQNSSFKKTMLKK